LPQASGQIQAKRAQKRKANTDEAIPSKCGKVTDVLEIDNKNESSHSSLLTENKDIVGSISATYEQESETLSLASTWGLRKSLVVACLT